MCYVAVEFMKRNYVNHFRSMCCVQTARMPKNSHPLMLISWNRIHFRFPSQNSFSLSRHIAHGSFRQFSRATHRRQQRNVTKREKKVNGIILSKSSGWREKAFRSRVPTIGIRDYSQPCVCVRFRDTRAATVSHRIVLNRILCVRDLSISISS